MSTKDRTNFLPTIVKMSLNKRSAQGLFASSTGHPHGDRALSPSCITAELHIQDIIEKVD